MIRTFIIHFLALLSLTATAQQSFHINGKLGSWNAPSRVYLAYKINDSLVLDSSTIQQGAFVFRGRVNMPVIAALLLDRTSIGYMNFTNNTADYYQFVLANENITVNGTDSMKNIQITGSAINDSIMAAAMKMALETNIPKAGTMAPLFEQPDSTGRIIKLADYRGKIVLVDFWASWCMPCRSENPNLVKAYQQFNKKGFEILSVSVDDASKRNEWLAAIRNDNMSWENVSDLKGAENGAVKLYHIDFIPQNFLVDQEGRIIATNLLGDVLLKKLEEIFAARHK